MSKTDDTSLLPAEDFGESSEVGPLIAMLAQRSTLPRKLEEGVYAILDAEGGVQVVETDGYAQKRNHDWKQAHDGRPEFVHRAVTLLDTDSFVDYLRRNSECAAGPDDAAGGEFDDPRYIHTSGELELWADLDGRVIRGILDGHDGLRKHTATLALKTSREWDEWAKVDGKLYPQADFASFIQDHISTIGLPDGGVLVDICETLVGTVDVQWKSQQLDATGQRQFTYEEVVNGAAGAKHDLKIPTELVLVVRPFQGSAPIRLVARFRFRLSGGAVQMGVKLVEPDRVLEDSFAEIVADVQARVPVHVNHGRP